MNDFLNKLERRFGRFAIRNLMYYIIVIYAVGAVIGLINEEFYWTYLSLDVGKVLHGQVWRLLTFLLEPYSFTSPLSFLFLVIELSFYYYVGRNLERAWGAFRFNLYYLSGLLFNILAAFVLYFVFGDMIYPIGISYISRALFMAFAVLFPDVTILLYFIIPVKAKWLGYLYGAFLIFRVVACFLSGTSAGITLGIAILLAVANFLIFFFSTRDYHRISPAEIKRKRQYQRQVNQANNVVNFPRHRCTICGRTERDNRDLEFRFCSKCEGDHEYCLDHLYTHEHIKTYISQEES